MISDHANSVVLHKILRAVTFSLLLATFIVPYASGQTTWTLVWNDEFNGDLLRTDLQYISVQLQQSEYLSRRQWQPGNSGATQQWDLDLRPHEDAGPGAISIRTH